MKKIIFSIFIIFFALNYTFADKNLDFENDEKYFSEKNYLAENFKKWEKKVFLNNCINFWIKFFWEEESEKACIIQIFSIKSKDEKFQKKIKNIENDFYKKNKIKTLEIAFWWDIMLSRSVWARNKKFWYDRIFKNFHPNKNFSERTILFYNLESPFSEIDADFDKPSFIFKANPKNISVLNDLKWKNKMIISLANNHITNAWWKWIDLSINLLNENNIKNIWVWREEPKFKEIIESWVKTCFSAYTYDWQIFYSRDKTNTVQKYFINKIDKEKIFRDLWEMKEKKCDFKVISLHWWAEYKRKPTKKQKKLAYEIIDNWADLILGHHSHILWEIEKYKWKIIYYSLWNFIFDQDWWKTTNESWVDYKFDEKLGRNTVQTYVWNTFHHKYEIIWENIKLIESRHIKHRIKFWELSYW